MILSCAQSSEFERLREKERGLETQLTHVSRKLSEVRKTCNHEREELNFALDDCERTKKRMADKQKEMLNVSSIFTYLHHWEK